MRHPYEDTRSNIPRKPAISLQNFGQCENRWSVHRLYLLQLYIKDEKSTCNNSWNGDIFQEIRCGAMFGKAERRFQIKKLDMEKEI